jgi:hypothetical protein
VGLVCGILMSERPARTFLPSLVFSQDGRRLLFQNIFLSSTDKVKKFTVETLRSCRRKFVQEDALIFYEKNGTIFLLFYTVPKSFRNT